MASAAPPLSPPPTASTSAALRPSRGSPTQNRLASGRPAPLPLDLGKTGLLDFDSPPTTADDYTSPRAGLLASGSPMTPDRGAGARAGGGGDSGRKERVGGGGSAGGARTVSWNSQGGAQQGRSTTHADPSTSSSRIPSSSSARLPPSASSASLSGRPRQTPSVLGYTSSLRRTGSPVRGGAGAAAGARSDPAAPLQSSSSATSPAQGAMGSSSRFLLTVVPPSHLPHDPPHPRTNPLCSGYGPPEHFRRGILVPLYPTLSAQLAAISREYGLPSTGGLVLYLLSASDPYSQGPLPGAAGFAGEGGPRINEAAWNLLWAQLFAAEEEEMMMLRDELESEEDDEYAPPPVPPLPLSHATLDAATRPSGGGVDENAVFSDDNERVSQSSDAGASGSSVYSTTDGQKSRSNSTSAQRRASSVARAGIGRGPPPSASLTSPSGAAKRFTSLPSSSSSAHLRQSSRHSLRSASHQHPHRAPSRTTQYAPYPPSFAGRSTSYGSYSPSLGGSPLPGYGASVVVGKVEFDINARARGGAWYETWLASASAASSAVSSALPTPATTVSAGEPWQELHLPSIVASKTPQLAQQPQVQGLGFDEDFTPSATAAALPRERSPHLSPVAVPVGGGIDDRGMESATSSFSLAALAAHVPDEPRVAESVAEEDEDEEDERRAKERSLAPEQEADSSIVDKASKALSRSSSSLPSRPVSQASTASSTASSGKDTDDTPLMDENGERSYQQLDDDEEDAEPLKPNDYDEHPHERDGSDGSDYGAEDEIAEPTQQLHQEQQAPSSSADPLGDVFGSDAATWRSFAADDSVPRLAERDTLETTGLGISGARISQLVQSAPAGVVERLADEEETRDERGLPPVQDDVADVAALLGATPVQPPRKANLASPIRLDSSAEAAEQTGVFPPSPVQGTDGHASPAGSSPFSKSHSTHTSISTVQFSVRPPSTIASMSPEFVPQRRQRQGWTNVPAVVDPSMSESSSMSSIAQLADSQRSSTIGLMENLDDLERALAELSPRAGQKARGIRSPSTILEEAAPPSSVDAEPTESFSPPPSALAAVAPPPRTSSAAPAPAPAPFARNLNSRSPFRYGMLSPPPELTPPPMEEEQVEAQQEPDSQQGHDEESTPATGFTHQMPGYEHDSPREVAASSAAALAPPVPIVAPEPEQPQPSSTVERTPSDPVRIPRSSSLNKPEQQQQQQPPQLVALPPSPMPNSPQELEEPTPRPAPAPLPPQPPFATEFPAPLPPAPVEPLASAPPPLPPRKDFPEDDSSATSEPPLVFPAPPPRSPGLKSLRSGKWGSKNKAAAPVEVPTTTSNATSPDPNEEAANSAGGKSPLGAFFGKSSWKAKGFFRRGDSNSPDASAPAPLPTDAISPPLPAEPVIPPRKESLDLPSGAALPFPSRQRRPSFSAGSQPQSSETLPAFPSALAANAASAAGGSPRPPFLEQPVESYQTAQTSIYSPPAEVSPAPSASLDHQSAPSPAVDSSALPPPPPMPYNDPSPSSPDFLHASPRSEYTPQTPRAGFNGGSSTFSTSTTSSFGGIGAGSGTGGGGPVAYPASAPATPADWRLMTPGGSFRPRGSGARKQRLSADIDQLLSQMNDLDFGAFGDDVGKKDGGEKGEEAQEVIKEDVQAEEKAVETEAEKENVPFRGASPAPAPAPGPSDFLPSTAASASPSSSSAFPPSPSPLVVEPEPDVELAYDGGIVAPPSPERTDSAPLFGSASSHSQEEGTGGLLRAPPGQGHIRGQDSQGRVLPLSADLSSLGAMMTGLVASPPMSPESNPSSPSYLDHHHSTPTLPPSSTAA
ncbi:hypothetical protein JCM6882_001828 [Rhodosporidiobolus microsporus]